MKTPLFLLAAFIAFFVLPYDFVALTSVLVAGGLLAILIADYRRPYRPIGRSATLAGLVPYEQFGLAA